MQGVLIILLLMVLLGRFFLMKKAVSSAVDEYFWLAYRKEVRKTKKFPPYLSQYLLDLRQWYPPLFGRFISMLPDNIFKRGFWALLLLSFFRFLNIYLWCILGSYDISAETTLISIIIYITSPIIVFYDNQLNSRIIGAIILDTIFILMFYLSVDLINWQGLLLLTGLMGLLLFVHKLTTQLMFIQFIFLSLILKSAIPLACICMAIAIAFLFGYKKYFLAHLDITYYWYRNRQFMSAHQIDHSPLYATNTKKQKHLQLKSAIDIVTIIGMCPYVILPFLMPCPAYWKYIIIITLLSSFLITFVPFLKCWGHGRSYAYYQPTVVICSLFVSDTEAITTNFWVFFFILVGISLVSLWQYYTWLNSNIKLKDQNFDELVEFLRQSSIDRILCIPISYSDEIAYKTRKEVLWGTHGYGFKLAEPYFPVLRHRIKRVVTDWNIGAIVLQKNYWPSFEDQVNMESYARVFDNKKYSIFAVKEWRYEKRRPEWAFKLYPDCPPQNY